MRRCPIDAWYQSEPSWTAQLQQPYVRVHLKVRPIHHLLWTLVIASWCRGQHLCCGPSQTWQSTYVSMEQQSVHVKLRD